jgi:hypothetical protein
MSVGVRVGVNVGFFLPGPRGSSVGSLGMPVVAPGLIGVAEATGSLLVVEVGAAMSVAVGAGIDVFVAGAFVAVRVGGSATVVSVISIGGAAPTEPAMLGSSAVSSSVRPVANRITREIAIRISLLLRNTSALLAGASAQRHMRGGARHF